MTMKRMRDLRTFSSSLVAVVLLGLTTQALANDDDDLLKEGLGFMRLDICRLTFS